MEFSKYFNMNSRRTLGCVKNQTLTILKVIYAGLIVCSVFVPSTSNDTDFSRSLTYDQIYNSTSYAQLQYLRPFNKPAKRKNNSQAHDTNFNGEEFKSQDKNHIHNKDQLLVGFARDPFGHSISEADYLKGGRTVDPRQLGRGGERDKRGVVHLYHMLTCATGCDPVAYKGYGCYCGFGGEGRPMDGIDNCCRLHDECYEQFSCPFYTVYFQPYYWKCYRGEPLCALENNLVRRGVNSCAGRLCDCDRRFAMCVRRYACPRGKAFCTTSPLRLLQNILMSK